MTEKYPGYIKHLFNKFYNSRFGCALPLTQRKISFILTTRCNFHCAHCFRQEQDKNKKIQKDLSSRLFEEILTFGKKLLNISQLSFTGGEPIMHSQFELIMRLAKQHGYRYGFATNGFFFKDYWRLIEKLNYRPFYVAFSLDGATAAVHDKIKNQSGSFARTIKAIRLFRAMGITVAVSCYLNKDNIQQIDDIVFLCQKLKVALVKFLGPLPAGNYYSLGEKERDRAKLKILEIQKKSNHPSIKFSASLNVEHPDKDFFCGHLCGCLLTVDPWGGLPFCVDIYKNIPFRPFLSRDGFLKSLIMHLETIETFKKQRARDLRRNKQPIGFNDCRYCNENLLFISRKVREKWK